ncbi:hypothetical protein HQ544_00415 [Candidatus Falkowbacteria bacterium]|nr:hypothetical protein [Candidatus Falkowbacteria bacterium]
MKNKAQNKKIILFLALITLISSFCFSKPARATNWFDAKWQYRKPITIDNSRNSINVKNYLLTLNFDYTNFDFEKANPSAYDFRFTLDDHKTVLDHDIEYYNYPESARVKIKIPHATAKAIFQIYLYYDAKTSVGNISKNLAYDDIDLPTQLEIFDQGEYAAPSNWEIKGDSVGAEVVENSNIWSYDGPAMSGTYALLKNTSFTQGEINLEMMSEDDDGIGVIFGSVDVNNYYRLAWFNSGKSANFPGTSLAKGLYLQKKQQGVWSTLHRERISYSSDHWYKIKINMDSRTIKISVDDEEYFDIEDASFRGRWVGLYSWGNEGSHFKNVLNLGEYENPNLYFPISYNLEKEESYEGLVNEFKASRSPMYPPILLVLDENRDLQTGYIYLTKKTQPPIAGISPYGWPVRIYIDNQSIGNAIILPGGEASGASIFHLTLPTLTKERHTLTAATYDPEETTKEAKSIQTITFEIR